MSPEFFPRLKHVNFETKNRKFFALGLLCVSLMFGAVACNPSDNIPAAFAGSNCANTTEILSRVKNECSRRTDPCQLELQTMRTDIYDFHHWALLWDPSMQPLIINGCEITPSLVPCPTDVIGIRPVADSMHYARIDRDRDGHLDWYDETSDIVQLCIEPIK